MLRNSVCLTWLIFCMINNFCCVGRPVDRRSLQPRPQRPANSLLSQDEVMAYFIKYGYLPDKCRRHQSSSVFIFDLHKIPNSPQSLPGNSSSNVNRTVSTNNTASNSTICSHKTLSSLYSEREILQSLKDFQTFMSLEATGRLNSATESVMKAPRCGVKDKSPHPSWIPQRIFRRKKRYVKEGSSWSKTEIKYTISSYSSDISQTDQKSAISDAFIRWAEVSPLVFRWTDDTQAADINLRFATGAHGDNQPFDGPGNVLAHAFYPRYGGDVHFDDDEDWVKSAAQVTGNKKNLLRVAMHEIGHSLGLQHSTLTSAVMHATYHNGFNNPSLDELSADDILGIQDIYGKCETSLDSVFSWASNGKTYFFKGSNSWKFYDPSREALKGYPQPISTAWKGVPNDIDEAFLWGGNYKTYFFKGTQYYKYNDALDEVETGYPKPISGNWDTVPDNIDAAFTLSKDYSYFFKGNQCYKYDNNNDKVVSGYPKNISDEFSGLPNASIDTVFKWYYDGIVYFFKGVNYYKYDNNLASSARNIKDDWKNLCFI